jgi:hypothetical protein
MGIKIERLNHQEAVYDITVQDNENFFANGILVHNCAEIDLPTKPLQDINDPNGEISLCTLAAINIGLINHPSDFEEYADLAVRALDELLDYQEYPIIAAQNSTMKRRPLGIGIINLAFFLAKRGLKYHDNSGIDAVHEYTEAWSYYLIKASVNLAKEKGACPGLNETKYGQGLMPIDTYKKEVDEVHNSTLKMDWEELRSALKKHGIRNSTLMACMPAECQSLYNEIKLKSGLNITLGKFIEQYGGDIDYENLYSMGLPQRFELIKPITLAGDRTAYEVYYNGYTPLTNITFDDGSSFKFTENHTLLVNRDGKQTWVAVKDLNEGDDILDIDA